MSNKGDNITGSYCDRSKAEKSKEGFRDIEGFASGLTDDTVLGYALNQLPDTAGEETISVPGPLGNKFFLKTPAQCKDINSSELVDRSLYFNNVPDGNTAFLPSGFSNEVFPADYSLMPSLWSLDNINSSQLYNSLSQEGTPECMVVTLETIDQLGNKGSETANLSTSDIKGMNPCWFPNDINPLTDASCSDAPNWDPPSSDAADAAVADAAQKEIDRQNQEKEKKKTEDAKNAAEEASIKDAKDQINKYRETAVNAVESISNILSDAETAKKGIEDAVEVVEADIIKSSKRPVDVENAQATRETVDTIIIKSHDHENVIQLDPDLAVQYYGPLANGVKGCFSLDAGMGLPEGANEGDGRPSVVIQDVGKGWNEDKYREFKDLKFGDQCKVKSISLPPNIEAKAYTASFGWADMCNQEVLQTVSPGAIDYEFTTSPCAFLFTENNELTKSDAQDKVAAETIAAIGAGAGKVVTNQNTVAEAAKQVIKDQLKIVESAQATIPDESSIDITNMDTKKTTAKAAIESVNAAISTATDALNQITNASVATFKAAAYAEAAARSKITITGENAAITIDVNKVTSLMGAGQLQQGCFSLDQDEEWQNALKDGDTCAVKSIALPLNVQAKLYSGGGGKWNDLCAEGDNGRNRNMDVYAAPGSITKFNDERPCGFLFTKVDPVCPPEFCEPISLPPEGFTNLHPALYNEEDDLYTFFSYLYYFSLLLLFGYIIKRAIYR